METIKWSQYFEGYYETPEEDLMLLVEKETMEEYEDNFDEPGYFFKGAAIGLIFCVPFWTIIFWLIV